MRTRFVFALLLLFGALALPALAADQDIPLTEVLSGKAAPLKLLLKELTPEWRRMTVVGNFDPMQRVFASLMSGQFGGAMLPDYYYTKGQTVTLNGELYLLAYGVSRPVTPLAITPGEGPHPQLPDPLKPDTALTLSLLCLRTVGSFTEITPFNLDAEMATSQGKVTQDANAVSASRLRQLATAVQMYIQDNKGKYPPMQNADVLKKAILNYVGSSDIFLNPLTKEPYLPNASLSGKSEDYVKAPTDMVVIYEATPGPDGTRGAGYADGHANRVSEKDWPALKARSGIQ